MDQKPALYLKDDELKMVKTLHDEIRDSARAMLVSYYEHMGNNFFGLKKEVLDILDDDLKVNCGVYPDKAFSNIPSKLIAERSQKVYEKHRDAWIKNNQELIQTELNRVKSEVKINEL